MTKLVHIRLPTQLYDAAKNVSDISGFSTVQEFLRNAIRNAVDEHEKRLALKKLYALKGSVKEIKRMSDKEKQLLAETLVEKRKKGYDVFSKYSL